MRSLTVCYAESFVPLVEKLVNLLSSYCQNFLQECKDGRCKCEVARLVMQIDASRDVERK